MKFTFEPSENNDIMHYAAGTQKAGAKYISRVKKNGKWVYTYAKNKVNYVKKHGITQEVSKVSSGDSVRVTVSDKAGSKTYIKNKNASQNTRPTLNGNRRSTVSSNNSSKLLENALKKKPEIDKLYNEINNLSKFKKEYIESGDMDKAKTIQKTIEKKQKELRKLQKK